MMPNPRTLIPALLLTSLVALPGAALAGTSIAGLVDVQAGASAHVDASGAADLAQKAVGDAQAQADAKVEATHEAAADAQMHAQTGLQAGLHALGGWIRGLFGAAQETQAHAQVDAQAPAVPAPPQPDVDLLAAIGASFQALIH